MWIRRNSKKQELETKELEERILRERREAKRKRASSKLRMLFFFVYIMKSSHSMQ